MSRTIKRVVIVGGGLAGLSAAEALARQHGDSLAITLLEAKRTLGGRAGSFLDPGSGQTVDYCQHVAMGCCTNLLSLLQRCGLATAMHRYRQLLFLHPDYPPSRLAPSRLLPPPLHLMPCLRSLNYLHKSQRRQVARGMWRLFRSPASALHDQVASDWLRANHQHGDTIRDFWNVIVVSALGEQIDRVSMSAVQKVFVDGFAAARGASDVLVPKLPLAELFGRHLADAIQTLGVDIVAGQSVTNVSRGADHVRIDTKGESGYAADHVIVAVPWHSISTLLSPADLPGMERLARIPASPISGVHLWFDRQLTDRAHAVLVGGLAQWLFRQPWQGRDGFGHYYQVVISASHRQHSVPKEQWVQQVVDELQQAFPRAAGARLLRSRVVTDPKSVFSVQPEVEAIRPAARTALPWLHLAGDWIATGWPATMEGAVISGRMAASSVAEREGLSDVDIDPGLPRGWLARRLIMA